jgi:hypothetical protein
MIGLIWHPEHGYGRRLEERAQASAQDGLSHCLTVNNLVHGHRLHSIVHLSADHCLPRDFFLGIVFGLEQVASNQVPI